jgi:hypothetical protein
MTNDKITLSQLETFLFSAADILRGKICAKASLELQIRCSIQLSYGRRLLQHCAVCLANSSESLTLARSVARDPLDQVVEAETFNANHSRRSGEITRKTKNGQLSSRNQLVPIIKQEYTRGPRGKLLR